MRSLQLNGKALKQGMENLLEARIIVAEEKKYSNPGLPNWFWGWIRKCGYKLVETNPRGWGEVGIEGLLIGGEVPTINAENK